MIVNKNCCSNIIINGGGGGTTYTFNDTDSILLDETGGIVTATLNVDPIPQTLTPTGGILIQNDADGQIETLEAPTCASSGADVSTISLGLKASNNNWGVVHNQDWLEVRSVSADTALIPAADSVIAVDATGGSRTVTLVAPVSCERRDFWVKRTDTTTANTVTITAQAGSTIDSVASISLATGGTGSGGAFGGNRGESAHIVWSGATLGWLVI